MPKTLPEIIYNSNYSNNEVDSTNSMYKLLNFKDEDYFSDYENWTKFIKKVEATVRRSPRYKAYIKYLKTEIQLNRCQVLKNVTDEDASINMHHGPIFTLFDVTAIILEYFLIKKWKIDTFTIADAVLREHEENHVQVVMVSTTVHEQIHNGELFINHHQAWGDLSAFTKKYWIAISNEYREQLNKYIDRSSLYSSNDFGVFKLNPELGK